jgi:uncharacterized membrane protein YhhN
LKNLSLPPRNITLSRKNIALLTAGAALSLGLHLRAAYFGPKWQVYCFKPLTTILVICLAWTAGKAAPRRYRIPLLTGLAFSLGGDLFLMGGRDQFIPGLASFLIAHLCYCTAFAGWQSLRSGARWLPLYLAYCLGLLQFLWPHLASLRSPVAAYGLVLSVMGWMAGARWSAVRTDASARAAAGAILFMISDSILAVDRFAVPFALAGFFVMTTYICAQWLIASSSFSHP